MLIEDIENNNLNKVINKIKKLWPIELPPYMYHVTKKENLESIKHNGLTISTYGDVHGSMDIGPPEPAIYLSNKLNSNNLNGNIQGHDLVSIKIDSNFINIKNTYIDDGFYAAFGNEDVFVDSEDISEELHIDQNESQLLLDYIESLNNNEIVEKTRFLLGWYIKEHGEIAVTHDIPAEAIKEIIDIKNPFS